MTVPGGGGGRSGRARDTRARPLDRVLPAAAIGAGAGLLCFVLGVPAARAVGLGVTAVGVALVFLVFGAAAARPVRTPAPPSAPRRATAPRFEIDRFDLLFARSPHLSEATRVRLLHLLDTELRARGSSFEAARADGSLGSGPWDLLAAPPARLPSRRQLADLSAAVRRVVPPGRGGPTDSREPRGVAAP